MVLPQECAIIQDPSTLEPERLTHAFLEGGRHQVIRDFWQDARANRDLEGSWHGAVVFASNQHVLVGTGSAASIPMAADETTRKAFPQSSQSSSSQPASSSNWANSARREFSRGVKRADFPSTSVSSSKSISSPCSASCSAQLQPEDVVITPTATLSCSSLPRPQDQPPIAAASTAAQVQPGPTVIEFDLSFLDQHLAEEHDISPTFDLRQSEPSNNKQILGWLASIFMPFVVADRSQFDFGRFVTDVSTGDGETPQSGQRFQMLKKLIFSGVLWCPRRLSDVQSHSIVPTAGIQGECLQQSSEWFSQDEQTGSHNSKGDRTAVAAISSPEAVESGGGDMHPRRGIHPSSSWQRSLLAHMPAVWRSLGKAASAVFKFNSSGDNHSSPGELSLLPATTKESTRPEDSKGDCAADEPRKGVKRVTWQDLREGGPGKNDWIGADASCQDPDARSSRSSTPRSRDLCASRQRIGRSRDGDRVQWKTC